MPTGDELKELRTAILTVKHAAQDISFDEQISKKIEEDFVNERKTRREYGQDHLKLALSLTKYICILEGDGKPDMESFKKGKELVFELMRRNEARCSASSTKPSNLK